MYYVHRYLRLTPPIMDFIGFFVVYSPLINGPWKISIVDIFADSPETCKNYWWRNLLYINNLFDPIQTCYGITWYLAVDTQLYFVAPIFLITFFLSAAAGYALIILCSAGSVAYVYAVTIINSLPATMTFFAMDKVEDFFSDYYIKPWGRCPVYLIGIAVGYFLASGKKLKLSKVVVVCGWIVAAAIALAIVYGPHRYMKGVADWR
ncbi:hypothetical protein OESDEN_10047 [Oesophagostomum dentatum]|uniref:Acyltransferase 3 domain-containing protein n=1 Tax=Oesophagostomum dentatum TaxID=61180 RepID=A0A0B1T423_OESDE|nr:hypothetical protein OESDEN_10047 [Oesophagostomum dentatum]